MTGPATAWDRYEEDWVRHRAVSPVQQGGGIKPGAACPSLSMPAKCQVSWGREMCGRKKKTYNSNTFIAGMMKVGYSCTMMMKKRGRGGVEREADGEGTSGKGREIMGR